MNVSTWHGTAAELTFIGLIGTCAPGLKKPLGRADLLRGYLAGAEKRANWKCIDRAAVVKYVRELLAAQEESDAQLKAIVSRHLRIKEVM